MRRICRAFAMLVFLAALGLLPSLLLAQEEPELIPEAPAPGKEAAPAVDTTPPATASGPLRPILDFQRWREMTARERQTYVEGAVQTLSSVALRLRGQLDVDSRVPPELLFGGLGLGQVFVARNAGNMVDTATMGTIEYGAEHLGAPLVVVLGHESCGAVDAACKVVTANAKLEGSMGPMVAPIAEVARAMLKSGSCDVDTVVRESAKRTAKKVAGSPVLSHAKTKVVAARYDLDDGKVEFLT